MRANQIGSDIEVVVWDTGVGIAAENMGKIFEGFFRVDTPYSRVTEGTGLGLPLLKAGRTARRQVIRRIRWT